MRKNILVCRVAWDWFWEFPFKAGVESLRLRILGV